MIHTVASASENPSDTNKFPTPPATICESKVIERISREVIESRQHDTLIAGTFAEKQEEEAQGWIKRHPVLFGTIVGFGAGFTIGLLSGGGDDLNTGQMGLYVGAYGAGVGALIGAVAPK